ncbi:hypothetical protein [Nostoc parmelioides]|uniref:Integrase n=1 Tax=Nostoc parmelioides FACHB-3921 TaxID=2692909 RepID=A0ABR8BKN6_9NOSO|nr:hypothetical protein [Nostoc parmelioides]MBD2254450.1 hypothetical protein [Nostoc parmelioides FACHB-3921]
MDKPNNVWEVLQEDEEYLRMNEGEKAQRIINELRTAIFHHALSEFGFQRTYSGRKMTADDIKKAEQFLKTLKIKDLLKLRQNLQKSFEKNNVSQASRNTYGSRLEQFLTRVAERPWWTGSRGAKFQEECTPSMKNQNGALADFKLTNRKAIYRQYALKYQEMSPHLQQQLRQFKSYLTDPEYPGRIIKPVEKSTANEYLKNIRLLLGFLHRFQNVPVHELSLESIVSFISEEQLENLTPLQQKKLWHQSKTALEQLVCHYFQFLRNFNSAVSPFTRMGKITAILALAKFLYAHQVENDADYQLIPIFSTIAYYSNAIAAELEEWRSSRQSVSDWSKRWPNVPVGQTALKFLQDKVVEPLRLECRPRNKRGDFRPSWSIVRSFQCYLKWALLSYLPARRQEEYRELKIALSCPIERPEDIPPDGLYQPLPPDHQRERKYNGMVIDNYLYFTYQHENHYYPQGIWVIDTRKYKTKKTYGKQSIILPNLKFEDGHCFYDYIERFLYGWWISQGYNNQQVYDWWQPELQGRRGRWLSSGRINFEPHDFCSIPRDGHSPIWTWGYVFVAPKSGLPNTGSSFSQVFETSSFRLIKKRISPHIMRYVWATWGLQVGLSDSELGSLAYAMGHSLKTLRDMYERCTPLEKRQPIEEAIAQHLFTPSEQQGKKLPLNLEVDDLLQMAIHLTQGERQQLIAKLQSTM